MAKAYLFNTSNVALTVSVNNGRSIELAPANTSDGQPSGLTQAITVQNNSNSIPGQFSLGQNQVLLRSKSSGDLTNFTLDIPNDKWFENIQLYLFWADAHSIVWVANLDGFYSSEASGSLNR